MFSSLNGAVQKYVFDAVICYVVIQDSHKSEYSPTNFLKLLKPNLYYFIYYANRLFIVFCALVFQMCKYVFCCFYCLFSMYCTESFSTIIFKQKDLPFQPSKQNKAATCTTEEYYLESIFLMFELYTVCHFPA